MNKSLELGRKLITATGLTACVLSLVVTQAHAVEIMPDFSTAPSGWTTDRYAPASFNNVGTYQGRNNVLGIGISSAQSLANRAGTGQNSTFYNTQGENYQFSSLQGAGSSISADLYIPSSWSNPNNGNVRTDIWGVLPYPAPVDTKDPRVYPIIGFSNYGAAGARFRIWDEQDGWVNLGTSVAYDAWTSLAIQFTGSSFVFSINGDVVYTDSATSGATGFSAVIMQAYNFADPVGAPGAILKDYTAYWSNAQGVPEGGATVLLLGAACVGLGWLRRRESAI